MSIVDALDEFIEQHRGSLELRHGAPMSAEAVKAALEELDVKLPSSVREVIERWGWLEIAVSPEVWPHTMFTDGLRFFGLGAPPELSSERQLAGFTAGLEQTKQLRFNNHSGIEGRVPVFGTLEGLRNCWVSNSRSVKWFNDFATQYDEIIPGEKMPKDQPLFGVTKPHEVMQLLLRRLRYRVKRAHLLAKTRDALAAIAATTVTPTQSMVCEAYPDVEWRVGPDDGRPMVFAVRPAGESSYDAVAASKPLAAPLTYVVGNFDGELHHTALLMLCGETSIDVAAANEAHGALKHLEELVQGRNEEPISLDVLEDYAIERGPPAARANWVALR